MIHRRDARRKESDKVKKPFFSSSVTEVTAVFGFS